MKQILLLILLLSAALYGGLAASQKEECTKKNVEKICKTDCSMEKEPLKKSPLNLVLLFNS